MQLSGALSPIQFHHAAEQLWVRVRPELRNRGLIAFNWWDVDEDGFEILPLVGVSNAVVTETLAALWPEPLDPYQPTAQTDLGELVDVEDLRVRVDTAAFVAERLADLYRSAGLPWIEQMEDDGELRRYAELSARREIVLPALLLSRGERSAALSFVERELSGLPGLPEGSAPGWRSWADLYGEFAQRVERAVADGAEWAGWRRSSP